jgi:hypothetical protein
MQVQLTTTYKKIRQLTREIKAPDAHANAVRHKNKQLREQL